jgi:hypothetical protein
MKIKKWHIKNVNFPGFLAILSQKGKKSRKYMSQNGDRDSPRFEF